MSEISRVSAAAAESRPSAATDEALRRDMTGSLRADMRRTLSHVLDERAEIGRRIRRRRGHLSELLVPGRSASEIIRPLSSRTREATSARL